MAHRTLRIVSASAFPHIDLFDQGIHRWVQPGDVIEVPSKQHWIDEVGRGALLAADDDTAKRCGAKFDEKAVKAALELAKQREAEAAAAHSKFMADAGLAKPSAAAPTKKAD